MKRILFLLLFVAVCNYSRAGWLDFLSFNKGSTNADNPEPGVETPWTNSANFATVSRFSDDEVADALRGALGISLQNAIAELGHENAFLNNAEVKIPLPDKLEVVQKGLKAVHEEKLADEFIATLNHAAEHAIAQAADAFENAGQQMFFNDPKAVITGPQDAIAQCFQQATETNLYDVLFPIVQQATASNGVTSAYKKMMAKVNPDGSGFEGKLGRLADKYLGADATDLDAYVTSKALDGLYAKVADEERLIRQDAFARTTHQMQRVFGAVQKQE